MKARFLLSLLVAALAVGAFSAAGGFGIINLDDVLYLIDRADQYGFKWAFTWVGDAMWTPLTWLSYWGDRILFGENWGAYHWHNLVLHGLSSFVLFFSLRMLVRDRSLWGDATAALATLVWAVHPLRAESVVWLASRKDCLSTVFFMGALWSWIRAGGFELKWGAANETRHGYVVAAIVLLVLGGMAKSSVMVFPAFALAIDLLVVGRRKPWWAYLVVVVLALGLAYEASWAQNAGGAGYVATQIPGWYRPVNAFAALTIYLKNFLLPTDLAAQCLLRYPGMPRMALVGFVALAYIGWLFFRYGKKVYGEKRLSRDPIVAGSAIFLVSLVPFLGLVGFGSHAFADRFTILPCIGLSVALVGVAEKYGRRVLAFGLFAVAVLLWLSVRQTGYWQDERTLFERTVAVDGETNVMAQEELVMRYYEVEHDYEKVFVHGYPMLRGPFWQQRTAAHLGPLILEAAYETGREKEAAYLLDWTIYWAKIKLREIQRENPYIGNLDTLRFVEVLRLAYSPYGLGRAEKELAELEVDFPESFVVKNLRYVLARRSGDPEKIKDALEKAYAPSGESYLHNRWSLNKVGTQE